LNAGETIALPLRTSEDIVRMRQVIREQSVSIGFSLVEQTKLVTAASELGRNTMIHGRGGEVTVARLAEGSRKGLRLVFEDRGPGIADIELAMKDGYTSGDGLGLGLGGAKRLSNEFSIDSLPGAGTRITIARWK
jgi:serine/threonine-protein kinase RsbT